jgi:ribosomal protein S18 acetylase RimI-like enzyme
MGELSFKTIELEVGQQNSAAIGLYKKYGFSLNHTNDQSLVMTLVIGN